MKDEDDSIDLNKPSFLFVLMERGEIDLETIVKNHKDNKVGWAKTSKMLTSPKNLKIFEVSP